jgi:hypothetical protein
MYRSGMGGRANRHSNIKKNAGLKYAGGPGFNEALPNGGQIQPPTREAPRWGSFSGQRPNEGGGRRNPNGTDMYGPDAGMTNGASGMKRGGETYEVAPKFIGAIGGGGGMQGHTPQMPSMRGSQSPWEVAVSNAQAQGLGDQRGDSGAWNAAIRESLQGSQQPPSMMASEGVNGAGRGGRSQSRPSEWGNMQEAPSGRASGQYDDLLAALAGIGR